MGGPPSRDASEGLRREVEGGKVVNSEFGFRNAEKSMRPRRLSGEKDLPQGRRDAKGLIGLRKL
jgi:hypothetical protein